MSGQDWESHKMYVVETLDRLEQRSVSIERKLNKLMLQLAIVKTKVAVYAVAFGGASAVLFEIAARAFFNK